LTGLSDFFVRREQKGKGMSDTIRVLIVEDIPTDAELMEYELQNAGMNFSVQRVKTEEAYISALSAFLPDVILSDYSLPAFDGITALRLKLERAPDTPFIFVTGALGEELAIDLLKQGATDYILKNRLARLPVAVSRALREVEERKEHQLAQATLRTTEELLRKVATAIEQTAESIMVTNTDGKVEYINPALTRITGYAEDDILGREFTLLRSDRHPRSFYDSIWQTVNSGNPWKGRLVRKRKDGSVYDIEETISPVKDRSGVVVNYVFVGRDVTEQIRLEEQLRHALKMEAVGTLAGGIAHDFNNMLSVIILNAELARDDVHGRPRINIEEIISASQRAADLVKQILTFSRKSDHEKNALNLTPLVKETYKLLRSTLPVTIEMRLEMKAASDTIMGDPSEVQQVLMNLATNAYHAMLEKGGRLLISLSDRTFETRQTLPHASMEPGRYVVLSVTDTGCGISEEVKTRIFEPFFTTKKPGQGTGLGLAVVYGIVQSHGAAVTVDSAVGRGSTFTVFFPALEDIAEAGSQKRGIMPMGSERLLVVDDEPSVVKATAETLQRLGYKVTTATSGAEAWKLFRFAPEGFDLIITDAVMPEMTGMTLAQRILEVRPDVPIILFTGFSENLSSEDVKAAGIREFLLKPFPKHQLAETVRRVLVGTNATR